MVYANASLLPMANLVGQFSVMQLALSPEEMPRCDEDGVVPGLLSMDTRPWTRVVIDGERPSSTPVFRERLLPGVHQVDFSNEQVGISTRQQVVIESGRITKVFGRFVADAPGLATVSQVGSRATLTDDCAADLVDPGYLSVDSEPWSQVWLDGRVIGSTPLYRQRIKPGRHLVQLVAAGSNRNYAVPILIEAGETTKLQHQF